MSEEEIKQQLRDWVVGKSKTAESVADDTPIIEQRVITSMQVMDLILFIEKLRGRPIDAAKLQKGVFRDINTIYGNFFVV
ncbi:MAG: hypothetical protein O7F14_07815 [Alphaproteobacteria bacterium]|nr:hypothetical protein [Alphaproteobacteria bacterium]